MIVVSCFIIIQQSIYGWITALRKYILDSGISEFPISAPLRVKSPCSVDCFPKALTLRNIFVLPQSMKKLAHVILKVRLLVPPGYQAPPESLLQAAGPPGARARPTSTAAARASTASIRASLFSMPAATTEVSWEESLLSALLPLYALWRSQSGGTCLKRCSWWESVLGRGICLYNLNPNHLVAPLTQADGATEEPGPFSKRSADSSPLLYSMWVVMDTIRRRCGQSLGAIWEMAAGASWASTPLSVMKLMCALLF